MVKLSTPINPKVGGSNIGILAVPAYFSAKIVSIFLHPLMSAYVIYGVFMQSTHIAAAVVSKNTVPLLAYMEYRIVSIIRISGTYTTLCFKYFN